MADVAASASVEDLVDRDPSFLRRFRAEARAALEDRMEAVAGVDAAGAAARLTDAEFARASARAREERKKTAKSVSSFPITDRERHMPKWEGGGGRIV